MEDMEINMLEFFKNKKVLITGHTGFKGSWLTKILVDAGAIVCGYSLEVKEEDVLFSLLEVENKIKHIVGDIRDLEHLSNVFDEFEPEFVIHLAAQALVRESYLEPVYTYETNVIGTVNICECVRKSSSVKSFLNVTTDKVYDNRELEKAFVEEDYLDGFDPYSNSKSCSELVTHSYKRSFLENLNIATSTARAGNVIGGGDFAKDRIIPDAVRAVYKNEVLFIRNPKSIRPFQHVLEPLRVYLDILKRQYENKSKYEGSFNVGPDIEDSIEALSLIKLFSKYWGSEFKYEIKEENSFHEAGFLKLSTEKLKNIYLWKARYNVDKAVEKTVAWYKAYQKKEDMAEFTSKQIKEFFDINE